MDKDTFQQYAKIKKQIKELTQQAKELEPELTESMLEAGADKVKTEFGSFTIVVRKKYEYSDKVKELESSVKELKKVEEQSGIAEATESKSLMFR